MKLDSNDILARLQNSATNPKVNPQNPGSEVTSPTPPEEEISDEDLNALVLASPLSDSDLTKFMESFKRAVINPRTGSLLHVFSNHKMRSSASAGKWFKSHFLGEILSIVSNRDMPSGSYMLCRLVLSAQETNLFLMDMVDLYRKIDPQSKTEKGRSFDHKISSVLLDRPQDKPVTDGADIFEEIKNLLPLKPEIMSWIMGMMK